jgi:hypothetical protein
MAKKSSVVRKPIICTKGPIAAGGQKLKTPEDGAREKTFLDLAKIAQTHLFERVGDSSAEAILTHTIKADEKLWDAMQSQLAEYGALVLIKALIKKTPHIIDDGAQLDLFPNMPRLITFKKRKVNLLKATTAELEWYGDWWNRRLEGLAKRTEEDLAISGEIERLKRVLKKYDPAGTVESALQTRNQRLEKARQARDKRRTRRRYDV